MKQFIRNYAATVSVICMSFTILAQDIHFSQFYNIPLVVNPAMTGAFNGDQRVALNYKDQWNLQEIKPYRTYALSFDMGLMKKKWQKSYLGAGLLVYRDAAATTMGTTQVSLSVSSFLSVGDKQKISAGLQGGFAQRSLSIENQTWDSQFCISCPDGVDPSLPTNESTASTTNIGFGDFTGGLQWTYSISDATLSSNDRKSINAGVAFHHLNRPQQKFDAASIDKMYSRITAHAGAFIGIKNFHLGVIPSVQFSKQGPAQEINFGTLVRYTIKEESRFTGIFKETAVSIGGYARAKDAFIPALQIEYANYAMGLTYDVNTSSLRSTSNGKGGFEISLRYINPNPFKGQSGSVRFL